MTRKNEPRASYRNVYSGAKLTIATDAGIERMKRLPSWRRIQPRRSS